MKAKDLDRIREKVEEEGLYYTFVHYSDFEDVQDDIFHKLRKRFENAARELSEYLNVDV